MSSTIVFAGRMTWRLGTRLPRTLSCLSVARQSAPMTKRGFTIFFTGLSGSGKSTLANGLLIKLLEEGKVISEGRMEVERCKETIIVSAEEAKRLSSEVLPLDAAAGNSRKFGFTLRVPVGILTPI